MPVNLPTGAPLPPGNIAPGNSPMLTPPSDGNSLSELKDIHLPEPISWWPLAPGWWILAAVVVIALIGTGIWLYRYKQRNAYRHEAQQALALLEQLSLEPQLWLQQLNLLLKRAAHTAYENEVSAKLNGAAWRDFLIQQAPRITHPDDALRLLSEGIYQSGESLNTDIEAQRTALQTYVSQWLQKHERQLVPVERENTESTGGQSC